VAGEVITVKYENGKVYKSTFNGIQVRFSLVNFSPRIINEFNEFLAGKAVQYAKENESDRKRG
jgi:hypothetical protein